MVLCTRPKLSGDRKDSVAYEPKREIDEEEEEVDAGITAGCLGLEIILVLLSVSDHTANCMPKSLSVRMDRELGAQQALTIPATPSFMRQRQSGCMRRGANRSGG